MTLLQLVISGLAPKVRTSVWVWVWVWVWVSDGDREAMRDLTRAREDMKAIKLKARQRLGAFLLRHMTGPTGDGTQAHFRWLEEQAFSHPVQQVV